MGDDWSSEVDAALANRRADGRFVVSVADIRNRVGASKPVARTVEIEPVVLSSADVRTIDSVTLDLALEVITEGAELSGRVASRWEGACRRCLDPLEGEVDVEVQELFEAHPTPGETYLLGHEVVDLEPAVREALSLALPVTPLCRDECRGPDPDRFPTAESDGDSRADAPDEQRAPDPRWAALADVEFD